MLSVSGYVPFARNELTDRLRELCACLSCPTRFWERIGSGIFLYSLANDVDEGWALNTEKLLRNMSAVALVDRGVFSHVKMLIGGYRALWRQKKLYILLLKVLKR